MQEKTLILLIQLVLVLGSVPASAQSAAELLEKGIYLEETAGQVDQAIEIYRRIVTDATADRAHVAEALLRLGVCQLQNGNAAAATEAFERVLTEYSDQESFVARAQVLIPGEEAPLELLPAPWEDGEVMRMTLKLASGTVLGAMLITADAAEAGGVELWRLRGRHKVFSDTDNQAIREVFVRRDTMVPVSTVFRHSAAGHFAAEYGDGTVSIETIGAGAKRQEKIDGQVFDSEELFHLFRRLPLEVGFKSKIKFIAALGGNANPVDVEVTGTETITVPAGEFECYRVAISAPQVFWYSTGPSRLLVKFEASGIVGELEEVYVQEPGRESSYSDEALGFSVSLPPDWLFHSYGSYPAEVLFLLDPNAEAQTRMEVRASQVETGDCFFLNGAQQKLDQARAALRDYALRDGTWREWYFGGWPAISFAGDYRELDTDKVHYWTQVQNGEFCVDFTLKVAADRFDALRAVFDSVIESYQAPPPPAPEVSESAAAEAARTVLADFHLAASQADRERFFGHLARDAIFFGPGAADRFDVEALRDRFPEAALWLGEPSDRHVVVSGDGTLAWFDERLDSPDASLVPLRGNLGELRGSGVLRRAGGGQTKQRAGGGQTKQRAGGGQTKHREEDRPTGHWRIVQYHVAMPVPNQLFPELVETLRAHDQEVGRQPVDFEAPEVQSDAPAGSAEWLLRDVHLAKAEGDGERFFGLFASDAVILGTDRAERYSVAAWRAIFGPYYARGSGRPATIPVEQHVYLSPDGDMAWFEELVERQNLGRMRGTGVIAKVEGAWKFVHYNFVLIVPAELAEDFARRIDAFYAPRQEVRHAR